MPTAQPPNVLLVVMDAARRDALTPYGADAAATPQLAALARRGYAYPRAYATSSWTLPSHASLFSGLLPGQIGLSQPPAGNPQSARPLLERHSERLLANVLRGAGYRCEGFSANLWASGEAGFDIGFDAFTYVPSQRVERTNALLDGGLRGRLAWALEGLRARSDDGAAALGEALRASIAAASGSPRFWFVNLIECHSPYLPPRPWNDLPAAERIRAAGDCRRHLAFESICLQAAGRGTVPADALARMRHLYRRSIAYMDDWLGRVLAALAARGLLERTLVIVTADHGESFGEDGLMAHGFSLGEQLIRVPLVIAGPGAGARDEVFSLAGLPRLVAEAASVDAHPYREDDLPAGVAVAEYRAMSGPSDPRVVEFAGKWGLDDTAIRRLTTGTICATDGRLKLVVADDGTETVYDLVADPEERAPGSAEDASVEHLRAALARARGREHVAAGAAQSPPRPSDGDVAALERQLKLLGYL